MKKLALIHTVKPGYLRFGDEIAAALPNVSITNPVDEFLAKEAVEQGISPHLSNRFLMTAQLAESTGADLIVCACTSMIPIIDSVRPFLRVPIILIDDEILEQTDKSGKAKIYSYIEYLNILRKDT